MAVKIGINGFGRIGRNFFRALRKKRGGPRVRGGQRHHEPATAGAPVEVRLRARPVRRARRGRRRRASSSTARSSGSSPSATRRPALEGAGRRDRDRVDGAVHRSRRRPQKHLEAGAQKVIISAPAKGEDITIVMGVNDDQYDPADAQRHLERLLHDELRRAHGEGAVGRLRHRARPDDHRPRVHERPAPPRPAAQGPAPGARGRLNIVPASTGAAKATGARDPRAEGQAGRHVACGCPCPDGSVTDLVCASAREATKDEMNAAFRAAAESGPLAGQARLHGGPDRLDATSSGSPASCTFDVAAHDGDREPRQGRRLVRQRVGLLEPPGRPGRAWSALRSFEPATRERWRTWGRSPAGGSLVRVRLQRPAGGRPDHRGPAYPGGRSDARGAARRRRLGRRRARIWAGRRATGRRQYSAGARGARLAELLDRPVRSLDEVDRDRAVEAAVRRGRAGLGRRCSRTSASTRARRRNDPGSRRSSPRWPTPTWTTRSARRTGRTRRVEGVAHLLPSAAGRLMQREVEALSRLRDDPDRPFVAILGGAKISDKLGVVNALHRARGRAADRRRDGLLASWPPRGSRWGRRSWSPTGTEDCLAALEPRQGARRRLVLPSDFVVAAEPNETAERRIVPAARDPGRAPWASTSARSTSDEFGDLIGGARTRLLERPDGHVRAGAVRRGHPLGGERRRPSARASRWRAAATRIAALAKLGADRRRGPPVDRRGASLEYIEGRDLPGLTVLTEDD